MVNHGLIAGIGAILLSTCTKEPGSRNKTLDNFIEGNPFAHENVCDGTAESFPNDLYKSKGYSEPVQAALSGVPILLQQDFFLDLNGSIELVPSAYEACTKDQPAEVVNAIDKRIRGCWRRLPDRLAIFLENSASAIQFELVRSFGYIYTEPATNRIFGKDDVSLSFDGDPNTSYFKFRMAKLLLTDVAAMPNRDYQLAQFKPRLPGADDKLFDESISQNERDEVLEKYRSSHPEVVRSFANDVFAESFDSWFCNKKSRADFEKKFPLTKTVAESLFQEISSNTKVMKPRSKLVPAALCGFHCKNSPIFKVDPIV